VPPQLRSSSKLADPKTDTKVDAKEATDAKAATTDSTKEEIPAPAIEAEADENKKNEVNRRLPVRTRSRPHLRAKRTRRREDWPCYCGCGIAAGDVTCRLI
jgi:hypothetical protein